MNDQFSWYTIEIDGRHAYLYLNNKKGLHRLEIKTRVENVDWLVKSKARREALRDKIGKMLAEVMQDAMKNPEQFIARMNESKNQIKGESK